MSLCWGAVATACLASAVATWLTSDAVGERAIFGSTGSVGLMTLAIVVTVAGIVTAWMFPRANVALRWGLALPVAVVAGGVAVEGFRAVFAPKAPMDVALGLLLAAAVVGMNVVATQVARRDEPARKRR